MILAIHSLHLRKEPTLGFRYVGEKEGFMARRTLKIDRLAMVLYPFVWGAVAINLFMLSLGWQAVGWQAFSPYLAMLIAFPLAVPATWLCTRWVRGLIAEAEK